MRHTPFIARLGLTAIVSVCLCWAATLTLDAQVAHQTIEGFGVMVKQDVGQWDYVDLYDPGYRQLFHDDLGVNVVRIWVPMSLEPTNDNSDPNVLDRSRLDFDGTGGDRTTWIFWLINTLKVYPDMKFIAAVLSPPAWMKDNHSLINGGHLLPHMREELAEYLVAFYRAVEDSCGVQLYGISIQNESAFPEPYGSCVYTAEEYREAFKVVGARFAREGIDTKLHGADDMLTNISVTPYLGYINADPQAKQYLSAASVHGYTDGVSPLPTSGAAQAWGRLGMIGRSMGVSTWMNECAGWQQSDAMTAALHIGMALKHGDVSMWVYLAANNCSNSALMCNKQHTGISAATKQYSHWVRPGAVRIEAAYSDPHLLINAFRHDTDSTLTVVVVNDTAGTRYVSLQGTALPAQMHKYSTRSPAATQKLCQDDGLVSTSGPIAIEGYNVVTLYGLRYNPVSVVNGDRRWQPARRALSNPGAPDAVLYRLDGTRVSTGSLAPGLYCTGALGAATVRVRQF